MSKLVASFLLCLLVMFVTVPILAQAEAPQATPPGVFIGTIIDVATQQPISDVAVIATSPEFQGERAAVADALGRYRLPLLPAGTYTLRFEHPDYDTYSRSDILLRANRTVRVKVQMRHLPKPVEQVAR
ncbi:carboxypeptidase-like regulatory domain-containing protein [Myxococcus sp. K15C18031901]|uniref:carboxypeptidase-like regulatory domain-containing protein n=1 Tax=Myxococcus dinghuensis TaxID=2906761 RepID=UPI0020A77147|nr:carboxypeptidase-like regulatory domain-containing protein [Myxococcus dinghuensis]MCP3103041.1 carboxypeptidase-like regulatory domain-containing protein [Myxococcus dinghuensis]